MFFEVVVFRVLLSHLKIKSAVCSGGRWWDSSTRACKLAPVKFWLNSRLNEIAYKNCKFLYKQNEVELCIAQESKFDERKLNKHRPLELRLPSAKRLKMGLFEISTELQPYSNFLENALIYSC